MAVASGQDVVVVVVVMVIAVDDVVLVDVVAHPVEVQASQQLV